VNNYTLTEMLRKPRTAQRVNPGRVALVFGDRSITYDELEERAQRLASALAAEGFRKGDRVGILLYNRPEWAEIFFAVAKLGGVMVPVNYFLKANEAKYILDDCGARWVIAEQRLWSLVEGLRTADDGRRYVGIDTHPPETLAYEQLMEAEPVEVDHGVTLDDLFLLQYTSGTTGFPKGAMHTHSTVLWNSFHQIIDFDVTADDVFLIMPALCWAAGFHDLALATLWMGGRLVLNSSTNFDPEQFFETVERHRVTKTLLVPSVLKRVLGAPTMDKHDLSSLVMVFSGGEPVPVTSIEEMHRRLPSCVLEQVYGMSEFPTMMLYLDAENAIRKAGSAGRACRAAEIRIVDLNGDDVPVGETGEIICRSPASMLGYYGKEDASASTLVDGWLHTGDLASVDDEGFVYVTGRSKDMIITGGLNVYPAEVERVIAAHPAVVEAAVVGVPDEKWGEIGRAIVVLAEEATLGEDELVTHLRAELATFKVPRQYELRHEPLPRTTSGKVQKFRLKDGA
jgi:fatty-acyl-CoA synthase